MMGGSTLSFPVTTEVRQKEVLSDDLCLSCPIPDISQMQGCLAGTTNSPDYFCSCFLVFFSRFSHLQLLPVEHPCTLPRKQPISVHPFLPGPRLTSFVCRKWQNLLVWKMANLVSHLHTHINSCQNRPHSRGSFKNSVIQLVES